VDNADLNSVLTGHPAWSAGFSSPSSVPAPNWLKHGMPALTERFLQLLPHRSDQIHLDIGCSNGTKTIQFALAGLRTIGLDQSVPALQEAERLVERRDLTGSCRFVHGSCLDLPFETGTIHSASDIMCLTHIPRSSRHRYERGLASAMTVGSPILLVLFSGVTRVRVPL
jgi:SAM-dependent methyltransferase